MDIYDAWKHMDNLRKREQTSSFPTEDKTTHCLPENIAWKKTEFVTRKREIKIKHSNLLTLLIVSDCYI